LRHYSLLPFPKPLPPFPKCRALPGSKYYGGSAPPQAGRPTAGPARTRTLVAHGRADRDGSRVHCDSLGEGGAQLYPCGIATATPQHVTAASRQTSLSPPGSSPPAMRERVRAAPGPYPPDLSRQTVKRRNSAGSSRTPLRHTRRTRTIWQYWHVPALSGLLPPSPALPGSGCPQLRRLAATRSAAEGLSPPLEPSAPHGARRSPSRVLRPSASASHVTRSASASLAPDCDLPGT